MAHWNDRRKIDWDLPGVPVHPILDYINSNSNRLDSILISSVSRFPIFKVGPDWGLIRF